MSRYRTLKLREQQEIGSKAAVLRAKPRQRKEIEEARSSKSHDADEPGDGKPKDADGNAPSRVGSAAPDETQGAEEQLVRENSPDKPKAPVIFKALGETSTLPEKPMEGNPLDRMEMIDFSSPYWKAWAASNPKPVEEQSQKEASQSNPSKPGKGNRIPRWTEEQDMAMASGYEKYGFRWTTIAQDPELGLGHRTGPQIRDRFRVKFPAHYQESVPLPLPEPWNRAPRKKSETASKPTSSKTSRAARTAANDETGEPSPPLEVVIHSGKEKSAAPIAQASAPKTRRILVPPTPRKYQSPYAPLPARRRPPPRQSAQPPNSPPVSPKTVPLQPSAEKPANRPRAPLAVMRPPSPESPVEVPPINLPEAPDPNAGRQLDIMQLLNHRGPPAAALRVEAEPEAAVRHLDIMGLLNDDSPIDGPAGLQDSSEPEAVRHMDIIGLLNDDHMAAGPGAVGSEALAAATAGNAVGGAPPGPRNRLPPVKSTLDDWAAVKESFTLPPLQWEDLAPRLMFSID